MKYYSTNKLVNCVDLENAVVKGLAEDKGLFMPNNIKVLPASFYQNIDKMSFKEIAYNVADAFSAKMLMLNL
jgi:threonine synthase